MGRAVGRALFVALFLPAIACQEKAAGPLGPNTVLGRVPLRPMADVIPGQTHIWWDLKYWDKWCHTDAIKISFIDGRNVEVFSHTEHFPEGDTGYGEYDLPYVMRDSTAETIRVQFMTLNIFFNTWNVQDEHNFRYNERLATWETGDYSKCEVTLLWDRQPAPPVGMVFVQPRYDTLFVGSTGATYGARAYAADGFTEIFTNGSAAWSSMNPSIVSLMWTSPGSGPFGYPTAVVSANALGQTILNATRQGSTGGAEITVIPVNGGGCGLPQC